MPNVCSFIRLFQIFLKKILGLSRSNLVFKDLKGLEFTEK